LLSIGAQSYNWIHKLNKQFGEKSALLIMLAGGLGELEMIANYLQDQVNLMYGSP